MALISTADVEKTAALAKLSFNENEKKDFTEQFNKIIGFVEKITEIDTADISPTTHAVEKSNVTRRDIVQASMPNAEIEKIAPKFRNGSIVVPRIIEH